MRVVLAAPITEFGGVWRHVVDVATGLQVRGCDVSLGLPDAATDLRCSAATLGLTCRSFGDVGDTDVWHVHVADTFDRSFVTALARARSSVPAVLMTEHLPRTDASDPSAMSPGEPRSVGSWSAKTAFKRAEYLLCDRIICVSQASANFLQIRYGVSGAAIDVVPNGISQDDAPIPDASTDPYFAAVGSVIRQKGFDLLLDAAIQAKEPWRVVVVGDGAHLATLSARAAELGSPVEFLGRRDDVPAVLGASLGLVLPSRWESWPYVVMEAMALGRPVVAAGVDGVPEIVVPGETGLLVPPEDAVGLAGALDLLASDPDLGIRLGEAGRTRARSFSLDTMVDTLLARYESSSARRRRPVRSGRRP